MTDASPRGSRRALVAAAFVFAAAIVAAVTTAVAQPRSSSAPPVAASGSPPPASPATAGTGRSAPPSKAPSSIPSAPPATAPAEGIVAVRIQIPRLGIDLAIVEGDGVSAPDGQAAHFPGTAWPGAGSNTYLYGHAQEGMFLPLWDARIGDEIVLSLVDGSTRCYEIERIQPETAWNDTSLLLPTEREQLTLQTSTSYTPTAPRFVVVAIPCS